MGIHIWRPRLLLAVCAVLAAGGSAIAVAAKADGDKRTRIEPVPGAPPVTVTNDDFDRAVAKLRADRRVQLVLQERPFEARDPRLFTVTETPGAEPRAAGVAFEILLGAPLASDGPWTGPACRGSRTVELTQRWSNVTVISVGVEPKSGKILSFIPGVLAPGDGRTVWLGADAIVDEEFALTKGAAVIRETGSGRVVASAAPGKLKDLGRPACPAGLADD